MLHKLRANAATAEDVGAVRASIMDADNLLLKRISGLRDAIGAMLPKA